MLEYSLTKIIFNNLILNNISLILNNVENIQIINCKIIDVILIKSEFIKIINSNLIYIQNLEIKNSNFININELILI